MPINLDTETVIPLAKAARELPSVRGNKPPHPATVFRWATLGIRSAAGEPIVLETTFIGGTRVTSKQALQRFFARKNDVGFKPISESAALEKEQLEKQAATAMRRMQESGLI